MRGAGDIVLVSCYDGGHQPAAVASAAAFLREAGFAPTCLDLAVEPLDDAVMARLGRARLIAISVPMHTALALAMKLCARLLREGGGPHVCLFGLCTAINPHAARASGADTILGADAHADLVALATSLAASPAVHIARAPQDRGFGRLPSLPPDRSSLPALPRYSRLLVGGEERVAGHVETMRGCLHLCRHCPIPPVYGGRFFVVSAQVVLDDVRRQIAAGARHITFGAPDFLNGPGHAIRLARALHAEHPRVTFDFTAKIEHIVRHRALFPELAQSGCVFVVSAVESLSDDVLRILDKGHTRADVVTALAIARDAGLSLRPTLMPFTPWATLADYLDLCRFIAERDLVHEVDPVQLSIRLLVPPGSLLLERDEMKPYLGPLDQAGLSYRWTHPDPRMDALQVMVADLVEAGTQDGEAAPRTFGRILELAARTAGEPVSALPLPAAPAAAATPQRAVVLLSGAHRAAGRRARTVMTWVASG